MIRRNIIEIDETKCDGCGLCVPACEEGAIRVVGGKARVVSDVYCDGLGACLGHCPRGAISIVQRAAAPFDHAAVAPCHNHSRLANWPVQLQLIPPTASYLRGADLLLVADCVPPACADFHTRFLDGRPVAIACPKLDNTQAYVKKLSDIIQTAQLRSITVVHMEVPCCTGLLHIAQAAVRHVGATIPVHDAVVTIRGQFVPSAAACL